MTDQNPQFELKRLSAEAIEAAMEKVQQYRLLNEPDLAESICRDIIHVEPRHTLARIALVLCLADQFERGLSARWAEATELVEGLEDPYDRQYYAGLICERRAKAHYAQRTPQCGSLAFTWLERAMTWYEEAIESRPVGDDSALLRWNTCARVIMSHPDIFQADTAEHRPPTLGE